MPTITNAGGLFVLQGSLVLDVPAGAVPSGTTVSITAVADTRVPPVAAGYQVHKVWEIDGNKSQALSNAAGFSHPLVGGLTTDAKLRFYTKKDVFGGPVPCVWNPSPESPLGDADVDDATGYLPPADPSTPSFTSYLALVQIP